MPFTSSGLILDAAIPKLVLDTNVVLDWLVFGHPSSLAIATAIRSGRTNWIVNDAMRNELAHVIGRGVVERWSPDLPRLWQTWQCHATRIELASTRSGPNRPRCTDADDQKFIDLALDAGADWLITRDRAVLKLARRARNLGLSIVTPEQFTGDAGRLAADPFRSTP